MYIYIYICLCCWAEPRVAGHPGGEDEVARREGHLYNIIVAGYVVICYMIVYYSI